MLGLKVATPEDRIFKFVLVFLQQLDRLGVWQTDKVGADDMVQSFQQLLVIELVEECHLVRTVFHHIGQHIFHHVFCKVHHIAQVCKGDLRLHHPEFCCVAGGIGLFCTEGWTEGVDVGECHCHALALQLTGNGQAGRFAEEVLAVIHLAVLGARRVVHIQCGDVEHLSCTLAVAAGDDWGVYINKATFVKEFVDCKCCNRTHAENCAEGVGARTQVCDGTQKFHRMTFFLKRIIRGGQSFDHNLICVDLIRLFCFRGHNERTLYNNGSTNVEFTDLIKIIHLIAFKYDLYILEGSTIVQFNKAQVFGCTDGSDPSGHSQLLVCIFLRAGCELSQFYSLHRFYLHNLFYLCAALYTL